LPHPARLLGGVRTIAENIFSPAGVIAFANAIGFTDVPFSVAGNGTPPVTHLGRRGTLRCIHVVVTEFDVASLNRVARQLRHHFGADSLLYILSVPDFARVCIACFNIDELCTLHLERGHIRPADVDALNELVPRNGEAGLQLALRHVRALDRVRITNRFFDDFRGQRTLVADAWQGIGPRSRAEREQLALLLLSRLMFLYFLQHRGFLAGDREFLFHALRTHLPQHRSYTFYRGVLRPLFFGVLNRRPEKRTRRAAALGALPYLNGGLFERHALERRFPAIDLPDPVLRGVFERLLERYRFTAQEGENDLAVDPEMLGRVFEGLMAETTRQTTGTFYTPAPVVRRMVRSAVDAYLAQYPMHQTSRLLREARVLDPACGSGAFLLGALSCLAEKRALIEATERDALRAEIVARNLHGVDVQQDAAMLCALRLWLALIPDAVGCDVQPLPNLDRRIRQGNALVDPLDLANEGSASAEVRAARRALKPLVGRYTTCDPEERPGIHRLVTRRERELSRAWLQALQLRAREEARELRALADTRDLFGEVPTSAHDARAQLRTLDLRVSELKRLHHKLRENGALPFFSFNVHFGDADKSGFDIILCNPPWVRSHNWPKHIARGVRTRYAVCRDAGQVDLAMIFLERAISLLAPGGTLAIVLPAKFLRSAAAGAARALMLEHMEILSIEDHSLDQRSIFSADAFATIIIARRKLDARAPDTAVTMIRRSQPSLTFTARTLSFDAHNPRSLWLLAPAAVRSALADMLGHGQPIGAQLQVRRGVVTSANAALIVRHVDPKLGSLAFIRTEGEHEAYIEDSVLRPLVRGSGIASWRAEIVEQLIFCHSDDTGAWAAPPRRARRYLENHGVMDSRGRVGALQHVGGGIAMTRVAWQDLANTLNAVVLPAHVPFLGGCRPVVPLNTVYFIALAEPDAHLLAAYMNSLPLRVFARAIAERAKDAHFRFFAGTVGLLPLPVSWRTTDAGLLRDLSLTAHTNGCISDADQAALDDIVAKAFGLSRNATLALRRFDEWLRGETE
jgi:tRNA1(Val) A37 N6-methylase TrmN6